MKKLICKLVAPFVLLGFTCLAPALSNAATGTVVVTNGTSYSLDDFYASPSDAAAWDMTTSLLPNGQAIPAGQSVTINIPLGNDGNDCNYDLMSILDGSTQYDYEYTVNVCTGGTWTLTQ